jgi:hypothetical protein
VEEEAVAVAGVAEEVVEGVAEEAVEEEAAAADNRAGTTQPLLNGGVIHQ